MVSSALEYSFAVLGNGSWRACIRLMILVLLLLESELPMADCVIPSQVSILEPLLGTLLEILLVPSKPHFPKFPHLGSCVWSMN